MVWGDGAQIAGATPESMGGDLGLNRAGKLVVDWDRGDRVQGRSWDERGNVDNTAVGPSMHSPAVTMEIRRRSSRLEGRSRGGTGCDRGNGGWDGMDGMDVRREDGSDGNERGPGDQNWDELGPRAKKRKGQR